VNASSDSFGTATWARTAPGTRTAVSTVPRVEPPDVEIVIPVYNEEIDLEPSVRRLHAYLAAHFPFTFRISIADNASTDATWAAATRLEEELSLVRAVRIPQKGRGRALHTVWSQSDAAVVAYMDVDLSTDLAALLPLVAPLLSGHSDLAIGTRLATASRVRRGPKRELISRSYNRLLHATLRAKFSDAQCGFKAIRTDRARALLPLVEDTGWFFDTELLVLAERAGLRIHEVPVDWTDDPDSRCDLVDTAIGDLKGVARLVKGFATGTIPIGALRTELGSTAPEPRFVTQVLRFAVIGVGSTLAFVLLYLLLRQAFSAQAANVTALLATTVLNTAANRRYTFAVRGSGGALRHQAQGFAILGLALVVTSGSLALLHAVAPGASRAVEVAVLITANLAATVLRFVLFRNWVFPRRLRSTA
jgi:glycosyltransferase involved in cell wall biosynthesis